jgi:hypothetical protein
MSIKPKWELWWIKNLVIANSRLDKFVYSASHDLEPWYLFRKVNRVTWGENDPDQNDYLYGRKFKQTRSVYKDIIDYSRNKRANYL